MLKHLSHMPATIVLISVWAVVWVLALIYDITPMVAGKGMDLIGNQYYRVVTAGFAHTGVFHLLANASVLLWLGYLYEQRVGSVKFLMIGFICAVIAQFIFLLIFRNAEKSVGGSGYVYALFGFCVMLQLLVPNFPKIKLGTWSGNWLAVYLLLSNMPIFSLVDSSTVVFHGISVVVGAAAALLCRSIGLMV